MKKSLGCFITVIVWTMASLANAVPSIRIESPPDNFRTSDASIEIKGAVANVTSLSVNSMPVRLSSNGRFVTKVNLREGSNDFILRAANGRQVTQLDLRVSKYAGKGRGYQDISYTFVCPQVPTDNKTTKDKFLIKATTRGATKAYINGQPVAVKDNKIYKVVDLPKMGRNEVAVVFANKYVKYATTVVVHRLDKNDLKVQETKDVTGNIPFASDSDRVTPAVIVENLGAESVSSIAPVDAVSPADSSEGPVQELVRNNKAENLVKRDGEHISVTVDFPPDNYTTGNECLVIRGEMKNVDTLYLDDTPVNLRPNGRFVANVTLHEGENTFVLRAAQGPEEVSRSIRAVRVVEKPKDRPAITYTFYSPENVSYTRTSKDKLLIKAKVAGATEAYVNGTRTKIKNNKLYYVVDLPVVGKNLIDVVIASKDIKTSVTVKAYRVAPAEASPGIGKPTTVMAKEGSASEEQKTRVIIASPKQAAGKQVPQGPAQHPVVLDGVTSTREAAGAGSVQKPVSSEEMANALREQIKKELYSEITSKVENKIERAVEKQHQEQTSEAAQTKKEIKESLAQELRQQIKEDLEKEMAAKKQKETEANRQVKKTTTAADPGYQDELTKAVGRNLPPVTLKLRDADVRDVVDILARKSGLNIVADESLAGKVTIDLHDVPFTSALNLVLRTHGYTYTVMGNTLIIGDRSKITVPTTLEPGVFKLFHSKADKVVKVLQPFLGKDESVAVAADENSIIAYASPVTLKKIKDTITNLDNNLPRQVFIEAKIIEVASNALKKLGIDWDGQAALTVGESGGSSDSSDTGSRTTGSKVSLWVPELLVNYIKDSGDSKVLASPKITAVDGEEALIHVGDQYPYVETDIDTKSGEKTTTVKFIDTGIKLKITPAINPENETIKLTVEPEVSFIYSFAGPNNEIPWVRTRKAETTVRIKNGQTVVIGGLLNTEDRLVRKGIPLLGDIPLVGNLFTNTTTEQTETELLIIITSKILE